MGQRAPRICTCGRKVEAGAPCQCQRDRARARPCAASRGYGSKWRRERAVYLAKPENHHCACGAKANTIAHKVAHKGDQRLFWDRKNWAPSCDRCNASQCAKSEGGFGNPVGGGLGISCDAAKGPGVSSTRDKPEFKFSNVCAA